MPFRPSNCMNVHMDDAVHIPVECRPKVGWSVEVDDWSRHTPG